MGSCSWLREGRCKVEPSRRACHLHSCFSRRQSGGACTQQAKVQLTHCDVQGSRALPPCRSPPAGRAPSGRGHVAPLDRFSVSQNRSTGSPRSGQPSTAVECPKHAQAVPRSTQFGRSQAYEGPNWRHWPQYLLNIALCAGCTATSTARLASGLAWAFRASCSGFENSVVRCACLTGLVRHRERRRGWAR